MGAKSPHLLPCSSPQKQRTGLPQGRQVVMAEYGWCCPYSKVSYHAEICEALREQSAN